MLEDEREGDPAMSYDSNNVFAKIMRGEIPSAKVYEDADALVIMDAMPQAEGHLLVIPKAPSRNLLDADPTVLAKVMPIVQRMARAAKTAFAADGITIMQFNEAPAGQTVFHLHIHVIPRYDGVGLRAHGRGMEKPEVLAAHADKLKAVL